MKKLLLIAILLITTISFSQKKMNGNYDYLGAVDFLGTVSINGSPLSQINTASTLVPYNATVSDAYTSTQPNRHITLAGNSSITVTGGVSGDSGLWYLYGTGNATFNNTNATTLVVPVSGLKVVYYLVDKDNNLTWFQDENSGGGDLTVQTATGDGATTINWGISPFMDFTFGAFNETITMTPPTSPERLRLKLTQDGVGSRTVSWVNNIYTPSGVMPTLSTGAGDIDVINLFWNGVDFELDEDFLDYQLVAGVDVTAPTAPSSLVASAGADTDTQIDLTWSASTDDVAVTGYNVYNSDVLLIDAGAGTSETLSGLTPLTEYNLTVRAYDAAGNISTNSNLQTISTTGIPASAFVFEMTTSGASETVDFRTSSAGNYDFDIDWGDGSAVENYTTTASETTISHTYATAGTYESVITGTSWGGMFRNGTVAGDLTAITQWGTYPLVQADLRNNSALLVTATDTPDITTNSLTTLASMFSGSTALTGVPNIGTWDVSAITSFNGMFQSCSNLTAAGLVDIDTWTTTALTNVGNMFLSAPTALNHDLSGWDMTGVNSAGNFNNGGTAWTTANIDATLIGWAAQALQSGVTIHLGGNNAGVARSAASNAAYTTLTTTYGWTIIDFHGTNAGTL